MLKRKYNSLFTFSVNEESEIVYLYEKNELTISAIAKQFTVDRDTISRLLKRNNVIFRAKGNDLRKYSLDEKYFDNINSEDKAYFLGLLYADGCNHFNDKKKKVTIDLQEQDKSILERFSKLLYNNDFLYFLPGRNECKNQYRLSIHSKIVSNRLNELGCVANKSLILKFPEWINKELQRHFIRGYFDGDGSVSKYERCLRSDYSWSMISTSEFCEKVREIIQSELNINVCSKMTCDNGITTTIYVRGNNQILKLMDWLYRDLQYYLERKYIKYLDLKNGI